MKIHATYLLSASRSSDAMICFYMAYCNGCPEKAAEHLWKMHFITNPLDGYAGQFVRANAGAVFTVSHESHEDTKYRYTLDKESVLTIQRTYGSKQWRAIYKGPWWEFVNLHVSGKKKLFPFKAENSKEPLFMTLAQALAYVQDKLNYAEKASHYRNFESIAHAAKQQAIAVKNQLEAIIQAQQQVVHEKKILNELSFLLATSR